MAVNRPHHLFSNRIRHWKTSRSSLSRSKSRLWQSLASVLLLAAGSASALPTQFSARYEVSHSGTGLTVGEALVNYRQLSEDRYRYSSYTRPLGLAALILRSEIKEVSEGRITKNGFKPDRYEYDRTGSKAREADIEFDWERMRVINTVSGDAWKMSIPKDALDRMVSQLQLMYDLRNKENDLTYRIADGGQIKEYTLKILGREVLATPYGRLDTVKIIKITDSDRRATTFWCAPALDYLPVRVEHRERGDNFSMTIRDATGFSVARTSGSKAAGSPRDALAAGVIASP